MLSHYFSRRWISVIASLILASSAHAASSSFHYQAQVEQLISQVNPQYIVTALGALTDLHDRDSRGPGGKAAATWIKQQLDDMVKASGREDVTVSTLDLGSKYTAPCIIMKIGNSYAPAILLGGHMDTPTDPILPPHNRPQPGADNNASGVAVLMETARNLLSSQMTFKKPIYLVWYAADADAPVGTDAVIKKFKTDIIPVEAVMALDKIGYAPPDTPEMLWLSLSNTDFQLSQYVGKLVTDYVNHPVSYTMSASDASQGYLKWYRAGYHVVNLEEAESGSGGPHSDGNDILTYVSLPHIKNFARLAVAFVIEKAEPLVK